MINIYILLVLMGLQFNGNIINLDKINNGHVKNGIKIMPNIHLLYIKNQLNLY